MTEKPEDGINLTLTGGSAFETMEVSPIIYLISLMHSAYRTGAEHFIMAQKEMLKWIKQIFHLIEAKWDPR